MHRRLEIDLLRTLAIFLMIAYHAAYDLAMFYGWNIAVEEGGWRLLRQSAATLFLLLVGISFVLSFTKRFTPETSPLSRAVRRIYGRRGLKILGLGMLLAIGSYLLDPGTFIRFGILHCIGISVLLLPFAMPLKDRTLFLGIGVILLGRMFSAMHSPHEILLPLNIIPTGFASIDFYPLLPWSGVVLIGAGLGWMIYGTKKAPEQRNSGLLTALAWPGRHALGIYFVHQGLIMGILVAVYGWPNIVAESLTR